MTENHMLFCRSAYLLLVILRKQALIPKLNLSELMFNKKKSNPKKHMDTAQEIITDTESDHIAEDHHATDDLSENIDPNNTHQIDPHDQAQATENQDHNPNAEIMEWKERYLRLQADFDNYRKRTLRETENVKLKAQEDFLQPLLPIIDQIELGITASETSDNIDSLREGLKLMHKNLRHALDKIGLQSMQAKGQPFDSALHEAIAQMPTDSDDLKGKIIEEVRKGYIYKERVLRYAQVIIGE